MLGKDNVFCFKCGENITSSSNGKIEVTAIDNADVQSVENEEPEKTKAWIGAIIGAIGVFFVYALIVEA